MLAGSSLIASATSLLGQSNSIVTVTTDKVLVVNGQKVFPIGFSPGPPTHGKTPNNTDALQELRDAGALLLRMTQTTDWNSQLIADQQAALDWAYQHGMFYWVNLRELSKFAAGDTPTETSLRNVVNTFKNHPALGLWKNFDEAWWGGVPVADLQRGYNVIHQEDTNHPVVQTHAPRGTVADLQPYNVAADILALDIYPVGYPPGANSLLTNKEISMVGDWTDFLGTVANGQKEYWMIEQIAWSGITPPGKTLRFPTFSQERFMAYQAIIHGARGLMFFGGNVAATLNAQDAALGWNWTFWDQSLKRVVQELGDKGLLADALTAPTSSVPIQVIGANDVEFCVREAPPYLYILACKREGATVNVVFSNLPPTLSSTGDLLYESPRIVTVQNGQFSDWFGPFEVHAYRFFSTNVSPQIFSQPSSRTNLPGTLATFSVGAIGNGTLSYQWRKNGLNLSNGGNCSGANSTSLRLAEVSAADATNYDVIVTGFGSVTSAPASLTLLNYQSNQVPLIATQPQSRTNAPGTIATFNVAVTGSGPFGYQWRKDGTILFDGVNVFGAASPALTLSNVSQLDSAGYDVVVVGYSSVTSSPVATLTVAANLTNQLILYEPFAYTNIGAPVSSNTPANWTFNGSGANDLNVADGSLTYSGLATSMGNSVTNGGAGLGVRRLLGATVNSGSLFFSALFRVNNLGLGTWSGASSQVGALTAVDNQSFRLAVQVALSSPSGYVIGVQKGGTGASTSYDFNEHFEGETVFLVGKYDFSSAPNTVYLWINPPASAFGSSTEPTNGFVSASSGLDGYTIDRFNIRQNTASSVPASLQWDELRVGLSWADVTPIDLPAFVNLTDVKKLANGALQFTYTNSSSLNYTVFASSNLVNWVPAGSANQISPSVFQFTDTAATNSSRRFYKLLSQ